MNVLAGLVDKQILNVAVRSHGYDSQTRFVVHRCADGADRTNDDSWLDGLRAHAAALNLVEAHLDRLAVILLFALVDGDVVHPHPVFLWDWRSIREPHGVAVVANL